jgi:Non-histone chromosomal protein MC1
MDGSDIKEKTDSIRYFKLIDTETNTALGRFTGETPKQAASKAFTKIIQKLRVQNKPVPEETTLYLRESSRGSSRKIYGYKASRQKLPEPQEVVIKDLLTGEAKTISYHYRNKMEAIPVSQDGLHLAQNTGNENEQK